MSILVKFANSEEVWRKVVEQDDTGNMTVIAETSINFTVAYEDDSVWADAEYRLNGEIEYTVVKGEE
jgi:hypothetical protein